MNAPVTLPGRGSAPARLAPIDLLLSAGDVDIVARIDVPARSARYRRPPSVFASRSLVSWVHAMIGRVDPRLHQSLALEAVASGADVVVSTGTASGKSFVFQAAAIRELIEGDGVILAAYPLKALAADQFIHWQRALAAAGLPKTLVAEITGDTPMAERAEMLAAARIIIATPDVIHSWLMRQIASPLVRAFLARLRFVIIDEAHVLEGEFGSNCAFFLRRLQAAQHRIQSQRAGGPAPFQIIAATATIANPAPYMHQLTGRDFVVIDEDSNGAPSAGRTLLHIDGPGHGAAAERMAADLVASLIKNIPPGETIIVFHDSRQGVERITRLIDRDDVLPYRSGYEPFDRKRIEAALRSGQLRAVVATSSMELGIDIPQFTIGFTIGVPNTRKAFIQRAGRVGRAQAGVFAVIAPAVSFAQLGSSLEEFHSGPVEQSALYLDNASIQFAQARCLLEELETFGDATELPAGAAWPEGFDRMFELAKPGALRPRALDMIAAIGADNPHLNYPLRHVCETDYALKDLKGTSERFGTIGLHQAIREAYPGATYYHLRQACKIRDWRSSSFDRSIRLERVRTAEPTMPLLRKQVNVSLAAQDVIDDHHLKGERGLFAEAHMQVNESVEGFRTSRATMLYSELRKTDTRMTRKQRDFASTGVILQISEPWFAGSGNQHVQTRRIVARALKEMLVRERSIQPKDVDFAETCVAIQTAAGPRRVDDAICIYDTVYGSLRLSAPLFHDLPSYIDRLTRAAAAAGDEALLPADLASKLRVWFDHLVDRPSALRARDIDLKPGEYLVFAPGSAVSVLVRGEAIERRLLEPQLLTQNDTDVVMYRYEANPGVQGWVPHAQLIPTGQDWRYAIWTPHDGAMRLLEDAA